MAMPSECICPLLWREPFLEIAERLGAAGIQPLQSSCTSCADWAGDAALGASYIAQEGWNADFEAFARRRSANATECNTKNAIRFAGSEAWRYCRRRLRMQMLVQMLPGSLRTWHSDGPSSPLMAAAALAAEIAVAGGDTEAMERVEHRPVGDYTNTAPRPDIDEAIPDLEMGSRATQDRLHIPGDLMDLLVTEPRPWRCGPLVLFDRFDHIAANPPYDVDLTVQVRLGTSSGESDGSSTDSDDEETPETHTYPAALSQWDCARLDEVQGKLVGRSLVLPPEDDRMALRPIPVRPDEPEGVMLVDRGSTTFADKVRNAADGGALGVLMADNQEQPLFRMVGASEAEMETLLPTMLVPKRVGSELCTLLLRASSSKGSVKISAVEACKAPRAFICIGRICAQDRGRQAELWVVTDARAKTLGHVIMVPTVGPAICLATSMKALFQDILELDQKNVDWLTERAPYALQMLKDSKSATAESERPHSNIETAIPPPNLRQAWLENHGDANAAAFRTPSLGRVDGANAGGNASNDLQLTMAMLTMMAAVAKAEEAHSKNPNCTASWNIARGECVLRLRGACRFARRWLNLDKGGPGFSIRSPLDSGSPERLQEFKPLVEMDLQRMLSISGESEAVTSIWVSSSGADVVAESCLLLEEQTSVGTDGRPRRAFWGAAAILEHVAKIAPSYVQQRWSETAAGDNHHRDSGMASCEVAFRSGQLCVRWADHKGFRGSFQKPLRNLFEVFSEVNLSEMGTRVVRPGDTVLVAGTWLDTIGETPAVNSCDAWTHLLSAVAAEESRSGAGWEDERCLDEPDGAWCLREQQVVSTKDSDTPKAREARWEGRQEEEQDEPKVEVFEETEEVVVLRARTDTFSESGIKLTPEILRFSDSEYRRLRLLHGSAGLLQLGGHGHAFAQIIPANIGATTSTAGGPTDYTRNSPRTSSASNGDSQPIRHTTSATTSLDSSSARAAVGVPSTVGGSSSSSSRPSRIETTTAPTFQLKETQIAGQLEFECVFPGSSSVEDLTLDVSPGTLRVSPSEAFSFRATEYAYAAAPDAVEVQLPFEVDPSSARARFKRGQGRLIVNLTKASPGS